MQNQKTVFSEYSAAAGIKTAGNKQKTAVMAEIKNLSDQALLSQTKLLAQKERSLHIQVLRHLREIESRRLYFSEGYASLFDYAVRGLGYSKGAAFRRINAMRLCRAEPAVEAKLKSGRLSLCAASQLQNFFEKKKREELKKSSESALISQTSQPKQTSQQGLFELEGGNALALQEKSGASLPEQEEIGSSAPGQGAGRGSALGQAGGSGQKQFMAGQEQAILRERVSSESELSDSSESELSDGSGGGQLRQSASGQINREQIQRQALEAEKRQALERRQKLDLIEKAEGRSSRETERLLLEQSPDSKRILRKDQVCFLGEGLFEVKAVIDEANHRKLEKLKFLLSHQNPSMGYGDLLGILLDLGLQKHDPSLRGQKPSQNRKKAKIKAAAEAEESRGSAPGPGASGGSAPGQVAGSGSALGQGAGRGSAPGQGAGHGSAPGLGTSHGSAPGLGTSHGSALGQANSRYIPAEVKRLVWARDRGRCSYVNPKTGQRCGSRYMLQMDHIKPYALRGRSTKENMRLLCAGHNKFRARQTFPSSARSRPASKSL